jgi:tRNA-binding protein
MLSLFYNKTTLQDTLVINVDQNKTNKIEQKNDFVYGLDENNDITFVNIFQLSNYLPLPEGYLHLKPDIQNVVLEKTRIDLSKYNSLLPLVVGKIIECTSIDNTHLHFCQVDIKTEVIPIVCGATNVRKGLLVVVAQVGAVVPNGLKISRNRLMGYDSNGMICSARELNLLNKSFNQTGIIELPSHFVVGQNFMNAFTNFSDK